MARILVFSGVGPYADPWHPFGETSAAVAGVLRQDGHDVVVRESEPGALGDLIAFDLLVVNSGGRTSGMTSQLTALWSADHRQVEEFHAAGSPILGIHTAVATFPDWPGWSSIIGGRWVDETFHPEIDRATFVPAAGVSVHPVWAGLESVEVFDERYSNLQVFSDATPLVQHFSDGDRHTMGWAVGHGVVYDGLGHDARSYESEGRRHLLLNEVHWLLTPG